MAYVHHASCVPCYGGVGCVGGVACPRQVFAGPGCCHTLSQRRVCSEASCVVCSGTREYVHACSCGLPCLTCVTCSLVCWPSSEATLHWPDLLSDPSIVGSTLQQLARGGTGRTLGPEEDGLSLVSPSSPAKYFSASGERGRGGGYPHALCSEAPRLGVGGASALPDVFCFSF